MAPLRNRAHRTQNDQDQMIEGLPIRNWRRIESNIGAPVEEQPIIQNSRWPELPMPRESHLLSDVSRQLLRLARLPKTATPARSAEDETKEHAEDEEAKKAVDRKGFTVRKWSQMSRDYSAPDTDYLAKRRKGLPPQEGYNSLYGPLGQATAFRTVKVKKFDQDGIAHVYEVMAPIGVAVEGELPDTDGGLSGPLEPRQAPGTIIDGVGIANEDGIIVAQPTPSRRKPPPPPRKKKRYFGRNKKKIETQYGADGLPIHPLGPSDGIIAGQGSNGQDTPMGEAHDDGNDNDNDNEQDDEDEEGSGEEGEEGEEGDEPDDEHDEERDDSSATPVPQSSVPELETPTAPAAATTPGLVPSSLRSEVKFDTDAAALSGPQAETVARSESNLPPIDVQDVVMTEAPTAVNPVPLEPLTMSAPESLPPVLDTLEPEPVVEPPVPEIVPDLSEDRVEASAASLVEPVAKSIVSADQILDAPVLDMPVAVAAAEEATILPEPTIVSDVAPVMRPVDDVSAPADAAPLPADDLPSADVLPEVSGKMIPPQNGDVAVAPAPSQEDTLNALESKIEKAPSLPSAPILDPVEPVELPQSQVDSIIPEDPESVQVPVFKEQTPLPSPVDALNAVQERNAVEEVPGDADEGATAHDTMDQVMES